MSWFSSLSTKLQAVTEQVAEQAKNVLPLDQAMMEKLTLTTPELSAERHRIDDEEKRKEHIKDCLAGMLPWETRDPERDILVEECKDVILKLSNDEATFKGPYLVPTLKVKLTESDNEAETGKDGDDDEDDDDDDHVVGKEQKMEDPSEKPSEESLDKLAKLEPLPKLLKDFDLDAHVGLIERLLAEDPDLVKMQSKLSGGGEREHYFWKNYFFHCAFARYEAGLSIDEIWNDEDPSDRKAKQDAEAAAEQLKAEAEKQQANADEETITFDGHHENAAAISSSAAASTTSSTKETASPSPDAAETKSNPNNTDTPAGAAEEASPSGHSVVSTSAADSSATDFEKINSDNIDDDVFGDDDGFDAELDELEAEIARELED